MKIPEWQERALCRKLTDEQKAVFFPVGRSDSPGYQAQEAKAKAVCSHCPVLAECREWALETEELDGVHGGLGTEEKWAVIRPRRAAAREARRKTKEDAARKVVA